MNSNRPLEDDLARDALTEFLNRTADDDTFLTFRHYRYATLEPIFNDEDMLVDLKDAYYPQGGVTFCVVAEPDSELLYVSVAECSIKDLFNKSLGREVSLGRFMRVGQYWTITWDRSATIAENLEEAWHIFGLRADIDDVVLSVKNRFIED